MAAVGDVCTLLIIPIDHYFQETARRFVVNEDVISVLRIEFDQMVSLNDLVGDKAVQGKPDPSLLP